MARPSLRQFILLIALSISVMLGLLGLWIGRDWGVQRAEAEARIASLLTTADLQEIFVRANRQRAAEHVLFYLPSTARLEQLVHTDEPIAPLADEMRRTLHSSIDAWLPIVPAMTDSIFRSLLAANQLRADYRLQLIDAVNGDTLFGVVHRYHAWHNLAFTPSLTVTDTLWLDEDATQAYVLSRQSLTPLLLAQYAPTFLLFLLLVLGAIALVVLLLRQEKLEKAATDLTHHITHELKTPIAVALAAHEALIDFGGDAQPERRANLLHTSQRQLQRLSNLVEQVLTFHRHQQAHLHLQRAPVPIAPLVDRLREELHLKADRPLALHIDVAPEVDTAWADATHLYNVLANLLDNALRYSPERADVTLRIWHNREQRRLYFAVADRGRGIARKHRLRIFRKFFRIADPSSPPSRGYGIGLAYVQAIVTQHGGRIEVESQVGKGSCFSFYLPDADPPAALPTPSNPARP